MRNGYHHIIGIGYCNAQHLLALESPVAYSAGADGWACDYYEVDGVLISTGYRPLKTRNARSDYDFIRAYDNKAREYAQLDSPEERTTKTRALLEEFVYVAVQNFQ